MPTTITGTDGVSQVQTGAVESTDLPSEAYQKNNILGIVAESGGVPTGAIIERGSNANGEFVKYADGTMQCWNNFEFNFDGNSSSTNSWNYPHQFIITPYLFFSLNESAKISDNRPVLYDQNSSKLQLRDLSGNFSGITGNLFFFSFAIGRWY